MARYNKSPEEIAEEIAAIFSPNEDPTECELCEEEMPGTVYDLSHDLNLCPDCKALLDETLGGESWT